ncbi:hypothetical protein GTR02_00370 [Kineococcus sp. R8]|uniref:VOC family protein n=1 Tax=Kineococcus siccus TaxID=2696567 RepID=UPI0014131163|nr:VOC family protein [Kineococcus siccus]NAZ80275.1 hypothetical protein [Kineococcus siccus]
MVEDLARTREFYLGVLGCEEEVYIADPDGNVIELLQQHDETAGRLRRQEIVDDGTAVPVAPGHDLIDPRQKYGSF